MFKKIIIITIERLYFMGMEIHCLYVDIVNLPLQWSATFTHKLQTKQFVYKTRMHFDEGRPVLLLIQFLSLCS